MSSTHFEIQSPLTPYECAARLREAIDIENFAPVWLAGLFGSRPVVGRITESSLRLRKRIGYRNSFQSFLMAKMESKAGGTLISGEIGIHPFVRVFMFIWFGLGIHTGVPMFLVTIGSIIFGSGNHQPDTWMGAVIPPVLLVFGYGLVRFGRYLARAEPRFLTEFLIQVLEAHEQISNT